MHRVDKFGISELFGKATDSLVNIDKALTVIFSPVSRYQDKRFITVIIHEISRQSRDIWWALPYLVDRYMQSIDNCVASNIYFVFINSFFK